MFSIDVKEAVNLATEVIMPKAGMSMEKDASTYDVIVIGGGPAGYVAAIKAAQIGGRVAIVEKNVLGGTCLNRGCIPAKTYIKNAEIIHTIKKGSKRGIIFESTGFKLDMEKVVQNKDKVVKTLTGGVGALLASNGVEIFMGVAKVTKDKKVKLSDGKVLEASSIIIAGGSKVGKINIPGIESKLVLTSDDILDLKEVPERLAIIGGGVIGVEMGEVFNAYGSQITIIEVADRIIPSMDKEISETLLREFKKKKIKVLTGTKLIKIEEKENKLILHLEGDKIVEADKALLSIGRVADLDAIEDIDIETEAGKIKVNEYMETSIKGIYAPGDVNGKAMLAHAAFKMGEIAAKNAMGASLKVNLNYVAGCIYTSPEVGTVGLTEEKAKEKYDIAIGKFPFSANGRALASGEGVGFVKVIADKKYGEILGIHIIGPAAAELINEGAALMDREITIEEAAEIIHGHPTFSEAFMEACADCLGKCIHLPRR